MTQLKRFSKIRGLSRRMIAAMKSRRVRWEGNTARIGEINYYRISIGIPERKRSFGGCRHRWENNIEVDLK
jgi:hypothetical protein